MPKNPNKKKGIESGRDVAEPETKGRDQIWAQRQKQKEGSNLGPMPENPKKKERIESGGNAREPESKQRN